MAAHDLFGGAMSMCLPPDFLDMSNLRQIPDNQEVFCHAHTDQSIIIELLQSAQADSDEAAARTHFEDLATTNDSSNTEHISCNEIAVAELTSPFPCSRVLHLHGVQHVSKYHEQVKNTVDVHLVMLRVPQHSTDVIVSFNDPSVVESESSSYQEAATRQSPWSVEQFLSCAKSIRLIDPGLFGDDEQEMQT